MFQKDPERCLLIETKTENDGSENSWSLGSCTSTRTYGSFEVYSQVCCLPNGDYSLTCKDSFGDGWYGGYITIKGNRYCENFVSGFEEKE